MTSEKWNDLAQSIRKILKIFIATKFQGLIDGIKKFKTFTNPFKNVFYIYF